MSKTKLLIVSGTNRAESKSLFVSQQYEQIAKASFDEVNLLSLEELNGVVLSTEMYNASTVDPKIIEIEDTLFTSSTHYAFIVPEYNGTFSGIFKYFIDALSIRDRNANFLNKQAALIGVAAGRAGNLRGLDQLTNALNYLGMDILSLKVPISSINAVIEGDQLNESTKKVLTQQINLLANA